MATERVWLGHDNTFDLVLKKDGVALTDDEMDAITQITISFDDVLVSSTNQADDPIRWRQSGYDTGEIRIDAGGESIDVGKYKAHIVVYDSANTDGVVWGLPVNVIVLAEVEAS